MAIPTKFFHDRTILILLIINSILLVVGSLLVLFRLDASKASGYIIQYRSGVGIGEFKTGSGLDMAGFVFFLMVAFALSFIISIRSYNERRNIALTVLILTSLLSLLTIMVSDALLVLR